MELECVCEAKDSETWVNETEVQSSRSKHMKEARGKIKKSGTLSSEVSSCTARAFFITNSVQKRRKRFCGHIDQESHHIEEAESPQSHDYPPGRVGVA